MSKVKCPRVLHLWAGLVTVRTRRGNDKPVLISAFGSDRDAVASILQDVTFGLSVDKSLFQKVTVTPGWRKATKAMALLERHCAGGGRNK